MSDPVKFNDFDHGFLAKPQVEYYLLGQLPFDQCQALQTRLAFRSGERVDGRISVILCEHETLISIGRRGSRAHIRLSEDHLRARQLDTRWVGRGGGCVLHGPGQLGLYVIAPLDRLGWSVGQFLQAMRRGLTATMEEIRIPVRPNQDTGGVWGRTGLLAVTACAVRNWTTRYGMYVNVNPSMQHYGYVDTGRGIVDGSRGGMSCLLAERPQGVKMSEVRSLLLENLARSLGCADYDVYDGHPWVTQSRKNSSRKNSSGKNST
jgi:lipoyl(octanoyl) transferase